VVFIERRQYRSSAGTPDASPDIGAAAPAPARRVPAETFVAAQACYAL
jgi:hypothetical protein